MTFLNDDTETTPADAPVENGDDKSTDDDDANGDE
jgi:hypothetical protein|tara:strand:+ start:750 stop:854 length:105 start_codon:yes stop_codon:yes gene_type:complete